MGRYTEKALCVNPECKSEYFPDRWGKIFAQNEGWFMQRNGDAWCPEHVPDWVDEWRSKKEEETDTPDEDHIIRGED